tara:strand:- start:120 stop:410 length:291 start_codon:yes stop_codon:yes gene_type:complete
VKDHQKANVPTKIKNKEKKKEFVIIISYLILNKKRYGYVPDGWICSRWMDIFQMDGYVPPQFQCPSRVMAKSLSIARIIATPIWTRLQERENYYPL